ncbi:MAG: hypothetical protein KGH84_03210 [Paracoccaceae bacterium]|nr:hypothetical protein [Paracoccaceae bacterium]
MQDDNGRGAYTGTENVVRVFRKILVVDLGDGFPETIESGPGSTITTIPHDALDRALLERVQPNLVVSGLFSPEFDAILLIELLAELGYQGQVQVICPPLPDSRMIRSELHAISAGIDVHLIETED